MTGLSRSTIPTPIRVFLIAFFTGVLVLLTQLGGSAQAAAVNAPLDTFSRSLLGGWGITNSGGLWTPEANATDFTVAGGEGQVSVPKSASRTTYLNTLLLDNDIMMKLAANRPASGFGQVFDVLARHNGNNNDYLFRVRIAADQTVWVTLSKRQAGAITAITPETQVPGIVTGGDWLRARVRTVGTSPTQLKLRVWPVAAAEPTSWALEATDNTTNLQRVGTMGLRTYNSDSSGATTFRFDNLSTSIFGELPENTGGSTTTTTAAPTTTTAAPTTTSTTAPPTTTTAAPTTTTAAPTTTTAAPTTTTAPAPPPEMTLDAGARPAGSVDYGVPSGANVRFVAPWGDDAATGGLADPWKTLTFSTRYAPDNGTLVLRGGVYREDVTMNHRSLTIQPYGTEVVKISGADPVTGFVASGSNWVKNGWTAEFSHTGYDPLLTANNPLAGYVDMVFVDGAQQTQVASLSELGAGKFYVDDAGDKLYLGTNPSGKSIEASVRSDGFVSNTPNTHIRGITFERFANRPEQLGAVRLRGTGDTLENVIVRQNATLGLSVLASDNDVTHVTASENGLLGIHANLADRVVIQDSLATGNNYFHFGYGSAEGGIKVTTSRDVHVRRNISELNDGQGIWYDLDTYNADTTSNIIRNNNRNGIQFEHSDVGVIADNLVTNNAGVGLYVLESSHARVWNNTSVNNVRALTVMDGARSPIVRDVQIRNNIFVGSRPETVSQIGVLDYDKDQSATTMQVTLDHNAYFRTSTTAPQYVASWQGVGTTYILRNYSDWGTYGQEAHGLSATGGTNPYLVSGGFAVPYSSPARSAGTAIPADILALLGGGGVSGASGTPSLGVVE